METQTLKHQLWAAVCGMLLLCAATLPAQTTIRYVKADATGSGASWTDASGDLQAVIDLSAVNDTVFVAAGTYTGGFYMKDGVQVYGGFAGTESSTAERSDPMGVNATILDGATTQRVLTQPKAFASPTVWDGFVLQNGNALPSVGSIVYNTEGTVPAGVIYSYDAATHSGNMLSLDEVVKQWGGYGTDIPGLPDKTNETAARADFSGAGSTAAIVKQLGIGDYAAYWCDTLTSGGFTGWYLPACGELLAVYNQKAALNNALPKAGGTQLSDNRYWSGSEYDDRYAWLVYFNVGNVSYGFKHNDYTGARAVLTLNSFSHLNNLVHAGGGALLFDGGVLRNCHVKGNRAFGQAGGVYAAAGAQVQGCLVENNTAPSAPGVYAAMGASVVNSTVVTNSQTVLPTPAVPQYKVGDVYPSGAVGTDIEGIVFWVDGSGEHGWMVALNDASTGVKWNSGDIATPDMSLTSTISANVAIADTSGYANTAKLRTYPTAGAALAISATDFAAGWHLPAAGQLNKLHGVLPEVNATLAGLGGSATTISTATMNNFYWSSTQYDTSHAWYMYFPSGSVSEGYDVFRVFRVRAVCAF